MFRSKRDVDRHVQDIFRKLKSEDERQLRSYNVAKLYYQVGAYETAKKYVSSYLELRYESAPAHKLLGQILEALNQKEAALAEYERSLEIDGKQDEIVLKVCELLFDVGTDVNAIKYWVERVDKLYSHHEVAFRLKEKMLSMENPLQSNTDIETLILSEITARPNDLHLHIKLIKHYMSKEKFNAAYNHAIKIDSKNNYRNNILWFESLYELLPKCKDDKQSDWFFWIFYISSLERYAALSIKEQGNKAQKTVKEATKVVFSFDQALTEMKHKKFSDHPGFTEEMFKHMSGQLHYHLACLFIKKTKQEQGSWSEAGRLCAPLFLHALTVKPVDLTTNLVTRLKDNLKNLVQLWYRDGSYRCSQSGHVLLDYAKNDTRKLMDKIDKFCIGPWRERIYQKIFLFVDDLSLLHQELLKISYFVQFVAPTPTTRLYSMNELKQYDEDSETVYPDSLHHHIWLGIKSKPYNNQTKHFGPYPHQYCHVFPNLQFSVYNLNQAVPESISRLDIDAFLNAAVLCSSAVYEEQQHSGFINPERLPTLPADLTGNLCTTTQEKWWQFAYEMCSKPDELEGDFGEMRKEIQAGLEVIRCIGNHGLHPTILVHLARIFQHRAKQLKEKNEEHPDIQFLEARSKIYWSNAISLLEKMQNNQVIRWTGFKLFNYQGKEMNNEELSNAIEEGKLFMVQCLLHDELYEQAIDSLQTLKCPEASFQQGIIYKKLAAEKVGSMPRESLTSEIRSQHLILLSKARNCFYLTLDRLRSPGTNPRHPLNSELCNYISDIENELKRIDPDLGRNELNRNECDGMSDESYSSAHSGIDQPISNLPGMSMNHNVLGTPQRTHRTPKQSSTPCRPIHHDLLDLSRNRSEARPSPERLDAQIRQMMHSKDAVQALVEQNKALVDANKTMLEKVEEMMKEMSLLRKEMQKSRAAPTSTAPLMAEENLYGLTDEDYSTNYADNQASQSTISGNMFAPSRHPYSPLVYPPPTVFQGYYQPGIPFNDPNAQPIPPIYPPQVYTIPPLYPNKTAKVPENVLHQSIFGPRGQTPLPQMTVPTTVGLVMDPSLQLQTKTQIQHKTPEPSKGADNKSKEQSFSKPLPVNVVITSSDTLPTTVPSVQPTLSVTIPAQHRLGTVPTQASANIVQQANVPHSYQISMPSQATIPTTVNLPPLSTTLTTAQANFSGTNTTQAIPSNVNTSSPNISSDYCEQERDPMPDFLPIIPLPAEVQVTTGEEEETVLYSARAKLFRFADKEWKERGVGTVKLLQNSEGKVRLLMRRDQVFKICANHLLRPEMELTAMPQNNKAWMWVANDYADEEVRLEKLCIRFKTAEEADSFKKNFDQARTSLKTSSNNSFEVIDDASTKSHSITTFEHQNTAEKSSSIASVNFGGFTFSSKPIVQKEETEKTKPVQKQEETQKPSPFVGFSFTKQDKPAETVNQFGGFSFQVPSGVTITPAPTISQSTTLSSKVVTSSETLEATSNVDSQPSLRRPHVANLPSTVKPIENEACQNLFQHTATLQAYETSTARMVMNVSGIVTVLKNISTKRVNMNFHNENNTTVYFNQFLSTEIKFTLNEKINSIIWLAKISIDKDIMVDGQYILKFENTDLASKFYNVVINNQQKSTLRRPNDSKQTQKSLSELFKPTSGSWECKDCYTRNEANVPNCVCCNAASNSALVTSTTSKTVNQPAIDPKNVKKPQAPLSELFKPATGSWECKGCYTRNVANVTNCVCCNAASPTAIVSLAKTENQTAVPKKSQASLSELFKPALGSWECEGCYTRNDSSASKCVACAAPSPLAPNEAQKSNESWECKKCKVKNGKSNNYCVTCDEPKDPSLPPKPKSNSFNLTSSNNSSQTFSFGMPADAAKDIKPSFVFGAGKSNTDSSKSIFSNISTTDDSSTKFVFGTQQSTATAKTATPFTFGSSDKTFDFQFNVKPVTKTPSNSVEAGTGNGGESDEEEVAESNDIYFEPVISLPAVVDAKTGEEDEEVLYCHRAKLFRFDSATKEWKERGLGDIKLLKHTQNKKLRLVMRREQIYKLCLNHALTSDITFNSKDEKTWTWRAADYSEGKIEMMQFACRFKTSDIAKDFMKALDDARKNTKHEEDNDNLVNNSSRICAKSEQTQDIEIVYEVTVSPEDKAAALELKLPENFYAYKQKEDCPGCIGCQSPEDHESNSTAQVSSTTDITEREQPAVTTPTTSAFNTTFGSNTMFGGSMKIFGGTAMSFGNSNVSNFNISKSTSFQFGTPTNQTDNQQVKEVQPNSSLENIKICSPNIDKKNLSEDSTNVNQSQKQSQSTADSPVGKALIRTPKLVFNSPTSETTESSKEPINNSSTKTTPSPNLSSSLTKSPASVSFSFSGGNVGASQSQQTIFGPPSGKSMFGGSTTQSVFGAFSTQPAFGTLANTNASSANPVFGSSTKSDNVFDTKLNFNSTGSNNETQKSNASEKKDDIGFLPATNISFSTLAAKSSNNTEAFKSDPNFSFEGAGTTVFSSFSSKNNSFSKQESTKKNDEEEADENDNDNETDEHDPHFEPIVPLPDAIVVRTGEEDEMKIFCQRAKLYRYSTDTKEWKERGVGEMKVLHHIERGTYRLLLRRDQVHKVVCNFLLSADVEFKPLKTSDRAWLWAGINYVEDNAAAEELAVKFKTPELALEFKDVIDAAQRALRDKQADQGDHYESEYDEERQYINSAEEDYDKQDEEEDDEEYEKLFEKAAKIFEESDDDWVFIAQGNVIICYDSDNDGERIVVRGDNMDTVSNTIITTETVMQANENECIWSSTDYVILEEPVKRTLKAVFSSSDDAMEMYKIFENSLECARKADVNDPAYYIS